MRSPAKHIKDSTIELYILKPETFSESHLQCIVDHLEGCRICREIEYFLRSFYEDLNNVPRVENKRVEDLIQRALLPKHAIALRPLRPQLTQVLLSNWKPVILAAQTSESLSPDYSPILVLTSDEHHVVVRVHYDKKDLMYRLYILAEEPSKYRNVKIVFPELAVDVTTDDIGRGEFRLGDSLMPINWSNVTGFLDLHRE